MQGVNALSLPERRLGAGELGKYRDRWYASYDLYFKYQNILYKQLKHCFNFKLRHILSWNVLGLRGDLGSSLEFFHQNSKQSCYAAICQVNRARHCSACCTLNQHAKRVLCGAEQRRGKDQSPATDKQTGCFCHSSSTSEWSQVSDST